MKLSPFRVNIIFTVFATIGIGLAGSLPVNLIPTKLSSGLAIDISWPGASARILEQEVNSPLEGTFNMISGIKNISSVARDGRGSIYLDLQEYADIDLLRLEVISRIRQLYPKLPEGVGFPKVLPGKKEKTLEEQPILAYSLSGNVSSEKLHDYAKEVLMPKLALIKGIRLMQVVGYRSKEWQVVYDLDAIKHLKLTKEDILEAISERVKQGKIGKTTSGNSSLSIRLQPDIVESPEDWGKVISQTLLSTNKLQNVSLRELAESKYTNRPAQQVYRVNGQTGIRLLIYADEWANILSTTKEAKDELTRLESTMPPSFQLHLDEDGSKFINEELNKIIQRTILSLAILLFFVLLVYRSWRHLLVITLALLAKLGTAIILYHLYDVQLHLYSFAAVTISFGMMIDNSIIVMHHLKAEQNHRVFPAVLASTLTTVATLVIIWFLPQQWQLYLQDFAKVVGINLLASLLAAWFLIPALMSAVGLLKSPAELSSKLKSPPIRTDGFYKKLLAFLIGRKPWVIGASVLIFGLPLFLLPTSVDNSNLYNSTLGHPWYVERIRPTVDRLLGGTLRLFLLKVHDESLYREAGETSIQVQAGMKSEGTFAQLDQALQNMETNLAQFKSKIRRVATRIHSSQYGSINIFFQPGIEEQFPQYLRDFLIANSLNLGGVEWKILGLGQGFNNKTGRGRTNFSLVMKGYNSDELERQASLLARKLQRHSRIKAIDTDAAMSWRERTSSEFHLHLNPLWLARQELTNQTARNLLEEYNLATSTDLVLPGGVLLRLVNNRKAEYGLWQLTNSLHQKDSTKLLLNNISDWTKESRSTSIHKENQQFLRKIAFEYTGSPRNGQRYLQEVIDEMNTEMPLGYSIVEDKWDNLAGSLNPVLMFALVGGLIFLICAVTFESVRQAMAVVSLVPLSFIGIFLTFYWFDFPFDQGGYTAFLLQSGLVVNSIILLINDYNYLKNSNPESDLLSLYIRAFQSKITPIVLTVISTILGLIPFLAHGPQEVFWFPFAVGTIGGLTFSLIVLIFLTPTFLLPRVINAKAAIKQ